ncbi:hypothetical protein RvY_19059 [Ramazzottius varieornatus]|uniref:CSC1/OSCA1-like 7TM region domain-containing protein n=1 Tax=Ramazzottius varieornatus TaxID=947166 RepID=A0A1D1WBH3_RAMVA|nr:hypothetical protein RvY_19059 [Ramazzottius varieornatus]
MANTSTTTKAPNPDADECGIRDGTIGDPFALSLGNAFSGIPQNLILNLIFFAGLLGTFIVLRKRGWGSSLIPLVGRRTNEWSSIFYGNPRALQDTPSALNTPSTPEKLSPDSPPDGHDVNILPHDRSPDDLSDRQLFMSWLKNAILGRDETLLDRCGPAALEYLRFQRHVIAFAGFLMIVALVVIMPVNFGGTLHYNPNNTFPATTIGNVDPKSETLWVHVVFTIAIFPMAILIMYNYGMQFRLTKRTPQRLPKTLMFNGLKARVTTEEKIIQHFREAFPEVEVTRVFLTLDVAQLNKLDYQLTWVDRALRYYEISMKERSERPLVIEKGYCCAKCFDGVDAVDYYQSKKAELEKKISEKVQGWKSTNPVFFVSFASEDMVSRVYKEYNAAKFYKGHPRTSVSDAIGAAHWTARLAPSPPMVNWENLSSNGFMWYAKAIVLNTLLIMFLIFLTTPPLVLQFLMLKPINTTASASGKIELPKWTAAVPFMAQFLPTILLLSVAGVIPVLLYYVVWYTRYHTKSKEMRVEMKMLFAYLLIVILILPSLALVSVDGLFKAVLNCQDSTFQCIAKNLKWRCVFLPDNGSLFVNLMITSAFIGTGVRLLRFGQLFVFLCRFFCCAQSEADRYIVARLKNVFPFMEYYPDFLLTFTIVAVYSFICPMITFFGLIALIMKHLVDRYNLIYAFGKSEAPNSVHAAAVNHFLVAILLQNGVMIFFFTFRDSGVNAQSALLITSLVINGLIYIAISWFGLFSKASLVEEFSQDDIDTPANTPVGTPTRRARSEYIPPVLQNFEARNLTSPVGSDADAARGFHGPQVEEPFVDDRRTPGFIANAAASGR